MDHLNWAKVVFRVVEIFKEVASGQLSALVVLFRLVCDGAKNQQKETKAMTRRQMGTKFQKVSASIKIQTYPWHRQHGLVQLRPTIAPGQSAALKAPQHLLLRRATAVGIPARDVGHDNLEELNRRDAAVLPVPHVALRQAGRRLVPETGQEWSVLPAVQPCVAARLDAVGDPVGDGLLGVCGTKVSVVVGHFCPQQFGELLPRNNPG